MNKKFLMNYHKDSMLVVPCRSSVHTCYRHVERVFFSSGSEKQIGVVTMAALAPPCPIRKLDKCLEGPSSPDSWWI